MHQRDGCTTGLVAREAHWVRGMYENLAILAIFIFLYSILSGGLERTPVNGALVFTAFGFLFGPDGINWLRVNLDAEGLRTLAELTLALVLFTDAANADLGVLRQNVRIPRLLLLVGLPLTIGLGVGAGVLIFDHLTLLEVALLATMLAPTDAALGKAVVTNPAVPARIREGLNVESGLNDGICVPVLFVFLALATGIGVEDSKPVLALKLLAEEIGIGLAVGVLVTYLASQALRFSVRSGWLNETWRQLPIAGLAMACFALAQWLGGSGFIACFVGGLLFGWLAGEHKHPLLVSAESTGDTLALITWVLFGAAAVATTFANLTWQVVIYAVLSLTVIRILPVYLALAPTDLLPREKLFVGWFGPRGLASIVFAVIVLNEKLPGGSTITTTVALTIVLSVVFHGLTANPLASRLASAGESGSLPGAER